MISQCMEGEASVNLGRAEARGGASTGGLWGAQGGGSLT